MTPAVSEPPFSNAHHRALEMTGPMLAAYLKAKIGRPLVARVTNARFANAVTRWEHGAEPDRHALNRMQLVATLLFALEESFNDGGGAARWLTLDNPSLGFRAPIDALADGSVAEVFAVARACAALARGAR